MATENTAQDVQQVAAMPAQPQNNIIIDTSTQVLKGREIYASMSQFGENSKPYGAGTSMSGEVYFTFKCKGAMINVPPAFQEAFAERKLYSITITGRPYNRKIADANTAGGEKFVTEQSWQYDTHMTIEDYKAAMAGEAEIDKLEIALEMQKEEMKTVAKAAKSVKVTPEREKELMEELTALIG